MFVPSHFRPFWQPNSQGAPPSTLYQDRTQLENLSQKLDAAEKKIDEHSRLIESLFAELRRLTLPISQPTPSLPLQTLITATEPSFPTSSSSEGAHDFSSGSSPIVLVKSLTDGNNNAMDNSTSVISSPQVTVTTALPLHSVDSDTEQSPQSTIETTTQPSPEPDWPVEYNPEIKKSLNIHIVDTFTFSDPVHCTTYSRDGKYLAVGLDNGAIYIYDMMMGFKKICVLVNRTATVFYTDSAPPLFPIWTIQFSLDNKYLATGGDDGQIKIWEIDRRLLRAVFKHADLVRCIDFSSNNHFLVSASWDYSVCLWAIRDGSRRTLCQHSRTFMSVAFSPNGQYVAAGNADGFVRIWDIRTSRLVSKFQIYDGSVYLRALVFTRNGQRIAVGDNTVQFWDISPLNEIKSGRHIITDDSMIPLKQIFQSKNFSTNITSLSFSSDNRWILSASLDSNIYILDAESGAWVCTLKGHKLVIWGADFSPAGHYMVSGSEDGRVRLWRYEMVE